MTHLYYSLIRQQWSTIESNGSLLDVDKIQRAAAAAAAAAGDNEMPITVSSST